jgi:catechol 2,3-dioxygenase-like lactoylglutathione lyase family enzyme
VSPASILEQQATDPLGADVAVTHILVVSDPVRSRDFWVNVLGAELYREYGGTSVVLRFAGTWLLLVSGGGPTADKPATPMATWWRSASRQAPDSGRCGWEVSPALNRLLAQLRPRPNPKACIACRKQGTS